MTWRMADYLCSSCGQPRGNSAFEDHCARCAAWLLGSRKSGNHHRYVDTSVKKGDLIRVFIGSTEVPAIVMDVDADGTYHALIDPAFED